MIYSLWKLYNFLRVAVMAPEDKSLHNDTFDGVMPSVLGPYGLSVVFTAAYIHT